MAQWMFHDTQNKQTKKYDSEDNSNICSFDMY